MRLARSSVAVGTRRRCRSATTCSPCPPMAAARPVVVVSSSVGDDGTMSVVLGADAADATTVAQWAAGDRLTLVRVL